MSAIRLLSTWTDAIPPRAYRTDRPAALGNDHDIRTNADQFRSDGLSNVSVTVISAVGEGHSFIVIRAGDSAKNGIVRSENWISRIGFNPN